MSIRHVVKEGECISSISFEYGFFRETLEEHADNAALKRQRENMNALKPGDVVVIPELRAKTVDTYSGSTYRFRRKGVPEFLHLRFLDRDGKPRAGLRYRIVVDGVVLEGNTDAAGAINRRISPAAREVELELHDGKRVQRFLMGLGKLPPISDTSGVQARLKNLGHYDGELTDTLDGPTKAALRRFQEAQQLPVTGEIDAVTVARLGELYEPKGART